MLTNTPLEADVTARLDNDPRIPASTEIAVSADGGVVTLRGTVENLRQRLAAAGDAEKVEGVYEVDNQLRIDLLGKERREDDEMHGATLQNLIWDVEVPSDLVDVKVTTAGSRCRATSAISSRATQPTTTCPGCTASTASRTRSGSSLPDDTPRVGGAPAHATDTATGQAHGRH